MPSLRCRVYSYPGICETLIAVSTAEPYINSCTVVQPAWLLESGHKRLTFMLHITLPVMILWAGFIVERVLAASISWASYSVVVECTAGSCIAVDPLQHAG